MATLKAKDLVRMAVAKVALMEPLAEAELTIRQTALVVGGGISGMTAARTLSEQGYRVSLVERTSSLGGQACKLGRSPGGEDIPSKLARLIQAVDSDSNISVYVDTELENVEGFVGDFKSTLSTNGQKHLVEHGVSVIATGAEEFKPNEYLYGKDPRVRTHLELDQMFLHDEGALRRVKTTVFIQCVGSREPERPYCSRVCCTHSVKSAIRLKELNPDMSVYVLYRDIRTYGEREYLYRKARLAGVLFIPFALDRKPAVEAEEDGLRVEVFDPLLGEPIAIKADLLSLATAIVPYKDERLARLFKIPLGEDGFFVEAHAKLGPSEFATDGVFLCGMAHYPKPIEESVAQAQAAASRAVTLLAGKSTKISGTVAEINPVFCSRCGVCVEICPYSAASMDESGSRPDRAEINPVLCKGCGLCAASCRSGAINLRGFGTEHIMAMIGEV
jgi:heterodisulfide reductase subunit A